MFRNNIKINLLCILMNIDNSNSNSNSNIDIVDINIKYFEECFICYNKYNIVDGITFNCKHNICLSCYQNILNNTPNIACPMCRQSLEISNTNEPNNIIIQEHKIPVLEQEHKEMNRMLDVILERNNYNRTRTDTNISTYCRYIVTILSYVILGIILLIIKDLLK